MNRPTRAERRRPVLALMTALILAAASAASGSGEMAPGDPDATVRPDHPSADLPLSPAELRLLGTWRGQTQADGGQLLVQLRRDRTASSWFQGGAIGPTPMEYVHWEMQDSGQLLMAREGANGNVHLIDAFWAPDEALRLSGSQLLRGNLESLTCIAAAEPTKF